MGNSQPTPSSGVGSTIIEDQVAEHCVFIYSATYCSYCTKAKNLLNDMNAQYGAVELDKLNSRESGHVFENLVRKTNVRTVSCFRLHLKSGQSLKLVPPDLIIPCMVILFSMNFSSTIKAFDPIF